MSTGLIIRIKRSRSEEPEDATQPDKIRLNGSTWTKHPDYFFKDGSLTLLADDHAFRVHASVLGLHSVYWKEELGNYTVDQLEPKELEDVDVNELAAFLSVVYSSDFDTHGLAAVEEWTSVLRLATLWNSPNIRSLAMDALDNSVSPFQRLVVARAHDIPDWIEAAFEDLSCRAEPLSVEEAKQLPVEDIIRITTARENILAPPRDVEEPPVAPAPRVDLPKVTSKFTKQELEKVSVALAKGSYEDVLNIVTTRKLPAFYHALADFTDLYTRGRSNDVFASSLFTYAVAQPSVTPLVVKILAFVARREPRVDRLFFSSVSECVQEKANDARKLWKCMADARTKYPGFDLAWRSATGQNSYGSHLLLGCRSVEQISSWEVYEERSTNLKRLIAALSADDVGLVR